MNVHSSPIQRHPATPVGNAFVVLDPVTIASLVFPLLNLFDRKFHQDWEAQAVLELFGGQSITWDLVLDVALAQTTYRHERKPAAAFRRLAPLTQAILAFEALDELGSYCAWPLHAMLARESLPAEYALPERPAWQVNDVLPTGRTLLVELMSMGQPETVRQVIAKGADLGALDERGLPLLHRAAFFGETIGTAGVMDQLLQSGADINGRGPHGATPLHLAVAGQSPTAIRYLLGAGADASLMDKWNRTAFQKTWEQSSEREAFTARRLSTALGSSAPSQRRRL